MRTGPMFRIIFYLLCTVFLITFLRGVIGAVTKGLGALLNPASPRPKTPAGASVPLTGELRRDPVCGTFVPTTTALKHVSGADTVHFCSTECRDKFLASAARR